MLQSQRASNLKESANVSETTHEVTRQEEIRDIRSLAGFLGLKATFSTFHASPLGAQRQWVIGEWRYAAGRWGGGGAEGHEREREREREGERERERGGCAMKGHRFIG